MELEVNAQVINDIKRRLVDGLQLIGEFVRSEAMLRAPADKGFLRSQMYFKVNPDKLEVTIGNNAVYAGVVEFGGDIRPKKGKALAVPVHPDAKGRSPQDFPDLVMIKPEHSDHPLLIRQEKGRSSYDVMFVLVPKVTIPAQPFLRPALYENRAEIISILKRADSDATITFRGITFKGGNQ